MALQVYFKKYLCLLLNVEFIDRNSQFFCLFSFHPALGAKETCIAHCFLQNQFFQIQPKKVPCSEAPGQVCEPNPAPSLLWTGLFPPSCSGIMETQAFGRGVSGSRRANADFISTVTGPDSCSCLICNL